MRCSAVFVVVMAVLLGGRNGWSAEALRAQIPEQPVVQTIRGTAVDDQTGKPIEKFQPRATIEIAGKGERSWTAVGNGVNGKFEIPIRDPGDTFTVDIDADGYLPIESKPLQGNEVHFDARLKRGTPITGKLLQPDGKAAADADILLREWYGAVIRNGRINRRLIDPFLHRTVSNGDGIFTLPPREGKVRIYAIHDAGWGEWIVDGQGAVSSSLPIHPWSTVEGTVMIGDKPAVDLTVELSPMGSGREPVDQNQHSVRPLFNYEATTDEHGYFKIERVVEGPAELAIHLHGDGHGGFDDEALRARLDLDPGEKRSFAFGGSGRPIIGKVVVPPDLQSKAQLPHVGFLNAVRPTFIPPAGFESLPDDQKAKVRAAFKQSAEYQAYLAHPTSYPVKVASDGSFRAEDIPAGGYVLAFSIMAPPSNDEEYHPPIAVARATITVSPVPGGRSDQPFDVTKVEFEPTNPSRSKPIQMTAFKNVKVGDDAPDFESLTYDGKTAQLRDLRGKWVLLDFWATWCGPCVAEMPLIEKLYQKFERDSRIVIIGVSLDDRQQEPARFLQNRKLPWLQWYGGASGPQSGFEAFGIHAVPSGWLISPEGKVVARDLIGDAVPEALDKALSNK